jgi:hypothetical protein
LGFWFVINVTASSSTEMVHSGLNVGKRVCVRYAAFADGNLGSGMHVKRKKLKPLPRAMFYVVLDTYNSESWILLLNKQITRQLAIVTNHWLG